MKANLSAARDGCVKAAGVEARRIVVAEGRQFHVRTRARKPIPLGAKLSTTTAKRALVEGSPQGFWSIINVGSKRHRIERKLKGSGKKRRAQLLRTPYGPRPYVLHPGHSAVGHPWNAAMHRVDRMPQSIYEPSIEKAFSQIWR